MHAVARFFMLVRHFAVRADSVPPASVASNVPIKIAIMPTTTMSSMSVNAFFMSFSV